MEIIILMIIVSIIGNAIKLSGQKQQTGPTKRGIPGQGGFPGQRGISGQRSFPGQGSNPRQGGIPGKGFREQSKQPSRVHKYPMEKPEPDNRETDYGIELILSEEESHKERRSIPRVQFAQTAPPMGMETEIQIEDTDQKKEHRLEFSQESIINGIIMSEVLGSPISRR